MLMKNKYINIFNRDKYEIDNLKKLLIWETSYINNDINIINYNYDDNVTTCALYFKNKFYITSISFDTLSVEVDNIYLKERIKVIFEKYNDIYNFFNQLDKDLNSINSYHPNFKMVSQKHNNHVFEWNPYAYLNILTYNTFNILELKKNAIKYFDSQEKIKSPLKPNVIIDIVIKELISIDNNEHFEVILSDSNIFNFDVKFKNFSNIKLISSLKNNNLDGIILNIKINQYLYPYFPPKILFKTNLHNKLDLSISKSSYFNKNNWNITNTFLDMLNQIYNVLNKEVIKIDVIDDKFKKCNLTIKEIIINNNINISSSLKINIDYIKINNDRNNDSKCWKSGIGYGTSGRSNWNINKYYDEILTKKNENSKLIIDLHEEMSNFEKDNIFYRFISNTNIFNILYFFMKEINLVDLDSDFITITNVLSLFELIDISKWNDKPLKELDLLSSHFESLCSEIEMFTNLDKGISSKKDIFVNIENIYESIKIYRNNSNENITNSYCLEMKKLVIDSLNFTKYFYEKDSKSNPSKKCLARIIKEISTYKNCLPIEYDSSIFFRYDKNNVRCIKVLIIGPKDTPYENGTFVFDIYIPNTYPYDPPQVNLQTTGNGSVRFNPNLYNTGKVCLSLLGTWSGEGGEKWNENTSTLLQVLISIQSLIFVENPYFNEPGYEKYMNSPSGKSSNFNYNDNVRFNTIKWAINNNLESSHNEFYDVISLHFKFKKDDIINKIEEWYDETKLSKVIFKNEKNKCIELLNNL